MRLRTLLGSAASLLMVAGCSAPTDPDLNMFNAHVKWATLRPASYSFVLRRWCECLTEGSGPVRIVVRDGVVESRHFVSSGAVVPAKYDHLWLSVDDLFAHAAAARRSSPDRFEVTYDERYGFPNRIVVDPILQMADEEYTYEATNFIPLSQ